MSHSDNVQTAGQCIPAAEHSALSTRRGPMRLVKAVQDLSLARDLHTIMAIVRTAAREMTGADGATFVLREGDLCYYAEEDAISALWKGQRFPMQACISGWAMLNRQAAVIPDIFSDPRVPADAYRPTFVKSLAMVPIRTESPIGAIGNYWARSRMPASEEVALLQALANATSVAMENVRVYQELEQRVRDRTAELEFANQELESFSYAVSHDLKGPLGSIRELARIVLDCPLENAGPTARECIERIFNSSQQMTVLIQDLLRLSTVSRAQLFRVQVDLSDLARSITADLSKQSPGRKVEVQIEDGMVASADAGLLRVALENLLANAWKYTSKETRARIEFGSTAGEGDARRFFVRDNGAGFEMRYAAKLFKPFERLHPQHEFPGTGVGLATVQRIIRRHGGEIHGESRVNEGATFYFTLQPAA